MMTTAEVCEFLGVHNSTLRRWRQDNQLIQGVHYVKFNRTTLRYNREWMDKFKRSGGRGAHKMEIVRWIRELKAAGESIDFIRIQNGTAH